MCSHLNMNTKPIPGLPAWVIAHTLPPVSCLSLFLLCPCFSPSLSLCLSLSLHPVNWTLATLRCFSHYSHHSGQIALSFRTIGLCSLAAPATKGLQKSFPLSQGCFRAKMGPRNRFHSTANKTTSGHWWLPAPCCTLWPIYQRGCKQVFTRGTEITCSKKVINSRQPPESICLWIYQPGLFFNCSIIFLRKLKTNS